MSTEKQTLLKELRLYGAYNYFVCCVYINNDNRVILIMLIRNSLLKSIRNKIE